jgi:Family of unknown function (DUF6445)
VNPEILQFDDFAPDAEFVRGAVTRGGFSTETGPDGARYTGISLYLVSQWFERIAELVGRPITPRLSCFRLNLAGELPHSWVHSDDICAKFASVLYLNPPEQCLGGTAFWKHKTRGIDRLPPKAELTARGEDADAFYRTMDREWKELQHWEQIGLVPMQFNRFITYPTCLFHSRYPFEAFGSGPKDGRLIWICFYD